MTPNNVEKQIVHRVQIMTSAYDILKCLYQQLHKCALCSINRIDFKVEPTHCLLIVFLVLSKTLFASQLVDVFYRLWFI